MFNKGVLILVCIVFFSSCSKEAPSLPQDYTSVDSQSSIDNTEFSTELIKLTCDDINLQLQALNKMNENNINAISKTRHKDQAVGYFASVFFPPLWLAIDTHEETKDKIAEVYKQKDNLYKLKVYKKCKS